MNKRRDPMTHAYVKRRLERITNVEDGLFMEGDAFFLSEDVMKYGRDLGGRELRSDLPYGDKNSSRDVEQGVGNASAKSNGSKRKDYGKIFSFFL